MQIKKYNKATAAVLSGAAVAVIGAWLEVDAQTLSAIGVILTSILVWLVPNVSA